MGPQREINVARQFIRRKDNPHIMNAKWVPCVSVGDDTSSLIVGSVGPGLYQG